METLIVGIILNSLVFGVMGATNKQTGIPHLLPRFLVNPIADILLLILYVVSFAIILLSPVNLFLRIIIAVVMQFLVNHLVWGLIIGTIGGLDAKKRIKNQ